MKNAIKSVVGSTKTFVVKHQLPLAILGTIAVTQLVVKRSIEQRDDFLKEHDLYEKFHAQVD